MNDHFRFDVPEQEEPTTKADVINAVANILIRLGKSDINDVRKAIFHASITFEKWVADRPEKQKSDG